MIARINELRCECDRLDELGSPEACITKLFREARALEDKFLPYVEVNTLPGLAAKIRAIIAAEFDAEDMPQILERLALDPERIGAAG